MNKSFRSIWNACKQAYVAAAETVSACGKPSASSQAAAALSAVLSGLLSMSAHAQNAPPLNTLPIGGQVSVGQASIQSSGAAMRIQQSTDRAAINWQSFNVGSQAQVQFQQPSAASVTLNRVMSSDPSQIFGRITANGQVILTNPQGVYFGPSARVDVGGLIATTKSISDADFMAGKSRYERAGSTGSVVNEGELRAALGGYIALLAPEVRNQGAIIAHMGAVVLASGEAVDLRFDTSNRLTSIRVEPSQIQALVDNRHAVQAPGGLIILSAQSMHQLLGGLVKNSGTIEAVGFQQQGGRIVLAASHKVENTGSIRADASASGHAQGPAGRIELSAPEVLNTGTLSAAGASQYSAGSVQVQATNFTQSISGSIDVSAPIQGGQLSIQATGHVQLQGSVSAQGTQDSTPAGVATQGGQIEVTAGGDIKVEDAMLDASGGQGGRIALRAASAIATDQPGNPQPLQDVPGQGRLAIMGQSTLSVRGRRGTGGSATVLGDHIELLDGSLMDATGTAGGGTVYVGGGWQGSGGLHQATHVTMTAGAAIDASATGYGDGGEVVLWSTDATDFAGLITSRGTGQGAAGGDVEVSGRALLSYTGLANLRGGLGGKSGNLLLDPFNLYIVAGTGGALTAGSANSLLGVSTLATQLSSASVTISTGSSGGQRGNVGLMTALSSASSNNLTITAAGNVVIAADVSIGGKLTVNTGADFVMGTNLANASGVNITANAGFEKSSTSGTSYLTGNITTNGTAITIAGNIQLANFNSGTIGLNSSGGTITLNSGSVSRYSLTAQDYALMTVASLYDGPSASKVGSDIVLSYASSSVFLGQLGMSSVQYLVVGGGGGGGASQANEHAGGGGGGSGVLSGSLSVSAGTSQGVTVGSGGAGGAGAFTYAGSPPGATGGSSTFGGVTALGGGGGGQYFGGAPTSGASGGGGSVGPDFNPSVREGAAGTPGQGFAGGDAHPYQFDVGAGGGGGAGGTGGDAPLNADSTNYNKGGAGGLGLSTSITGSSLFYGAGGGGGGHRSGVGGSGVGGSGGAIGSLAGQSGAANTGSGGGGAAASNGVVATGGSGADGVVVVRYAAGNAGNSAASSLRLAAGAGLVVMGSSAAGVTLDVDAGGSSTVSGALSGTGSLTKAGVGTLVLTATNTYSGTTTINGGTLVLQNDAPNPSNKTFNGSGVLRIEPAGTSFTSSFSTSGWTFNATLNGLALGKIGNTAHITIGSATSIAGPIAIYGGNIAVNAALTATNSTISLTGTGNVTDGSSGSVSASNLLFGGGNVTLDSASNNVSTLAASGVSSLTYVDSNALTIGSVGGTNGLTASGAVTLTTGGALSTSQAINAGSGNITLNTDDLALAATVTSSGTLQIQPKTTSATLGVGSGTGTLTINATQLAWLQDGFSRITLGGSSTGAVNIGGLTSWSDALVVQAGTSADLQVTGSMSWSHANPLTLAAGGDIYINANLAASHNTAALSLFYGGTNGTTTPTSGKNFYVNLASGSSIQLTGSAPQLTLGNVSHTVVNTVAALAGMTSSGNFALGQALDLSGQTYTNALYSNTFTGRFDGLGNAVDGLTIRNSSGGNLGLFAQVNGASLRQLGVTNVDIVTSSINLGTINNTTDYRVGAVIGNVGGVVGGLRAPTSSATTLYGLWSTGVISTSSGSGQRLLLAGGLIGSQNGGTMTLSNSYSRANVSSQGSYSSNLALGGLVGDIGINTNVLTTHTTTTSSTVAYTIEKSYATGSIAQGTFEGYVGSGGLVGVIFSSGGTLTDSFSWGNVVGTGSFGGIAGYALSGTYARNYTTQASAGAGSVATASSYNSSNLSGATGNGTQLPTGWDSAVWAVGARPTLKLLSAPPIPVYVKQTLTSGTYGTAAMAFQLVNDSGTAITLGTGAYAGLTATTGSAKYSINGQSTPGTYSVSYQGGLSFTGTDAGNFTLNPWSAATSYALARAPLTIATSAISKTYDGTLSAISTAAVSGTLYNNHTLSGGNFAFTDKNVGNGNKTVTVSGVTVNDSNGGNNYTISYASNTTSTITAKALSITGLTSVNKVYDGTLTAAVSGTAALQASIAGGTGTSSDGKAYTGDAVSLTGTALGAFNDKDVADATTVSFSGLSLTGASAGNYTLTPHSSASHSITAKALSITGLTSANKVYDGTLTAVVNGTAALQSTIAAGSGTSSDGKAYTGDTVSLTGTALGAFNTKDVATANTVNFTGLSLSGAQSNNYALTPAAVSNQITRAPLTIYANNDAKFVTTADPSFTVSYSPFVTGESATTAGVLTSTPTVGVDRTSTLNITNGSAASGVLPSSGSESAGTYASALVPSGAVAPNYQISYVKGSYTVVAAEQLLVRVQSASSVYGAAPSYTLSSAQYLPAGSSTPVTIGSVNVTGSAVAMNDGAGTTAAFNLTPLNATLSATQNTSVGSYQLGATGITIAPLVNPNFRSLTVVGDLSVTPKTLTPNANNATKVYDGTISTTGLSIGLTGVVTSGALADTVSATGEGAFATRNAGATTYAISSLALTGADAGNYAISNAPISGAGTITAKTVTLAAPTGSKVYDGQTSYTVSAADLTALSAALGVAGDTVSSISLGFDNKNVGTSKTLTPTAVTVADGNSGNNYSVTLAANSSSAITRLSSVTWVGGSTGNYFDPANWAGGAVPDLSNVANVVIPAGTNVSFGSTVVAPAQSGAVNIDSLGGAAGALTQTDGTLNVGSGGVTLSGFTQSGGTLTSAGAVTLDTLAQTGGSLDAAGAFTVTQRFSQGTSGSITVGGNTRITNTTGGLVVGNLNTTGTTGITSTDGDITQATGTTLVSFGAATLVASSGGLPANITLTNAANDFVGAVSASGANVALTDVNALTLATVVATGDLSVTSSGALNLGTSTVGANLVVNSNNGAITQTGALSVAGTSGLNAGTGNITLTNAANDFVGAVSASGANVALTDVNALTLATVVATGDLSVTSSGALNLGTSTVGANLVVNSNNGAITQTGALSVAGTSGLNAGTANITLTNAANDLIGVVTSTGGVVNLVNLSAPSLGNSANDVAAQIKSALPANWPSAVAQVDATPPQPLVMASAAAASAAKASSTTETAGTSNSAGVTVDLQAPPDLSTAVMMMAAVSLPKGTSTVGAGFSFELPERA